MKVLILIINKIITFSIFCLVLLSLLTTNYSWANGRDHYLSWRQEFCIILKQLSDGNIGYQKGETDKYEQNGRYSLLLKHSLSIYDENESSIPIVFDLWARYGWDSIEKYWWDSRGRATRCFIVALYLCTENANMSYLSGYIERLNKSERFERNQEVEFVLKHRSDLAAMILKCLDRCGFKKSDDKYNGFLSVKNKSIGTKLPDNCLFKEIVENDR
jgi:hypothetical protein